MNISYRNEQRITTRLLLLLGIFALLIIFLLLTLNTRSPADTLAIFRTRFLGIFIEAAPFLLLGSVVSGLLEVFITREDIVRMVPRNPIAATVAGAFLGFAFPVCECGVVPVTRRLFTKGLPMSVGVAFLLAAPVMNPIVFASTLIAFGWGPILWARFAFTALIAIGVGVIFAVSARPQEVLRPVSFARVAGASGEIDYTPLSANLLKVKPETLPQKLIRAMRISTDDFFDMGRFLIIGSALAAAMQTFVAQESLLAIGQGPLVSVIAMQALAFVLSVCSTVDAFLALAFTGTFTGGAIVSFLTFGPMVDIKSTLMFASVFQRKTIAYLIVLPFLISLLFGLWLNLFTTL